MSWSENIERLLNQKNNNDLQPALKQIESTLSLLADLVLADQPTVRRRKLEHLVYIQLFFIDSQCILKKKNYS